jgi:hypothetical protein
MDVKFVFINGNIEEELYICQPLASFVKPSIERWVRQLHKTFYGLQQLLDPWKWSWLNTYLNDMILRVACMNPSLYILLKGDFILFLIIYVNELLIIKSHTKKITW